MLEAIALIRLDRQTDKWGIRWIGRKRTNRNGCGRVERIFLDDHRRSRLAEVVGPSTNQPDFSAFHVLNDSQSLDTASTKR